MSWDHPLVLGLAPLCAAFAGWMFRGAGAGPRLSLANIRRLWADENGLHEAPAAHRRRGRGVLLALGALLAVAALARPQWGTIEETTYDQSREVLLALDLSRSMLADDVSPTRLERAKLLVDSLLDQLRGERVGLVVFAGTSFLQVPMSAEYDVLRDFLRDLDPSYLPQGGTNYGAMLQTSLKAFSISGEGDRFLVVLSDGEAHDEEWKSLLPSVKQRGIRILGLGIGSADGGLVPDGRGGVEKDEHGAAVLSRLEPETLQELSTQTGGAYRDAAAWVDLGELVNATVAQGKAGRFVEKKEARLRDQYQWLLAPALLVLMLSFWLDFPVLPVPRTLQRRQIGFAPVRTAVSVATLLLLLGSGRAYAAVDAAEPNALEQTVATLADKPALAAGDYAELASTTIGYASQPDAARGPSRLAVIDDALRGIDAGEHLDSGAADWPELRRQLEALKKQEEEKKEEEQKQQAENDQQPQQQDQQKQDEQRQQQQQQGSQGENDEQQQQAGSEGEPDQGEKPPSSTENSANDSEPGKGNEDEQPPQQDATGEEPKPLDDADAKVGELKQPEEKPAEEAQQQPQQPSRMVGGGAVQPQQNPSDPQDVAMIEALDRMQRVQDADSPATLFERMNRAEGVPPPAKSGKNW